MNSPDDHAKDRGQILEGLLNLATKSGFTQESEESDEAFLQRVVRAATPRFPEITPPADGQPKLTARLRAEREGTSYGTSKPNALCNEAANMIDHLEEELFDALQAAAVEASERRRLQGLVREARSWFMRVSNPAKPLSNPRPSI